MAQAKYMTKAHGFVDHLLNIPTIRGEPLPVAEGLILNFIVQNMTQLKATFKTPSYFPDLEWEGVLQLLLSDLYARVAHEILPIFITFLDNSELTVLNVLNDGSVLPADFHREKLTNFINAIFKNKDARYHFNSIYSIFRYEIIEKYLSEIFKRRGGIYNELVRVQKTNLECDEYIIYLKVLMLVKNAASLKIPMTGAVNRINIYDALKMPGKLKKYVDTAADHFRQQLPNLSARSIRLALLSNMKSEFTENEDASSRFIYILASRFHNYRPLTQIDRGAESPDKSWFSIARKNADYYGFDRRMLESLYRIAGDNNW